MVRDPDGLVSLDPVKVQPLDSWLRRAQNWPESPLATITTHLARKENLKSTSWLNSKLHNCNAHLLMQIAHISPDDAQNIKIFL